MGACLRKPSAEPVVIEPEDAPAAALAIALALARELWSKNLKFFKLSKVLRMGLPMVENLSGLSGNTFSL